MSAIILNMDTGSPTCFIKKWIVFISKQTNFNIEIGFGTGLNAFITFGRNKNESINRLRRVKAYPRKNWFHELRRRIECFESQGCFDKMHQSNWGEKRI
jgi:hypothetical protein